jgi:serine protease Do
MTAHLTRIGRTGLVVAALTLGACGGANPAQDPATAKPEPGMPALTTSPHAAVPTQSDIADLVEHVSSSVVNITTVVRLTSGSGQSPFDFFFPDQPNVPRERQGAGTGFIVDAAGFVVTNAHVVEGADEVHVVMRDGREASAEVVGRDKKLDLALLKMDGVADLPAVSLGDSDVLRVGEYVLAVGNPFGLGHTVTMGIVSAKARAIGAGPYDDFIQTDASINPGNSGGPLFNLRGEVVGINTAIRAGADGIGFAIPINMLKDVVPQLRQKGYVERGKLGLAFQAITPELAKALGLDRVAGALVSEIVPGSAAAKAGVLEGDVILGVDDVTIVRAEELPRNVARHPPGATIQLHLRREGKDLTLQARLDKLEDEDGEPPPKHIEPKGPVDQSSMLGLDVEDDPTGGVKIVSLRRPQKDLEAGDVIVEVNNQSVGNVDQLKKQIIGRGGDTVLFKVRREGKTRYVGVPLAR